MCIWNSRLQKLGLPCISTHAQGWGTLGHGGLWESVWFLWKQRGFGVASTFCCIEAKQGVGTEGSPSSHTCEEKRKGEAGVRDVWYPGGSVHESSHVSPLTFQNEELRNLALSGHVGFDSLPDQLVNKSTSQGFCFNILCVGKWLITCCQARELTVVAGDSQRGDLSRK